MVKVMCLRQKTFWNDLRSLAGAVWIMAVVWCCGSVFAQEPVVKKIEIVNADITEYSAAVDSNAWRLKGHVEFFHEGVTMYCDSAWWYRNSNTMDAFSNIVISKPEGDNQVVITGDFLRYRGDLREAEIWRNVVLTDKDAEMKTDHLYYDMNTDICYYLNGADITNADTKLYSKRGHFHRLIRKFYFKKDVEMHSPDYDITTDTLIYYVARNTAEFVGPSYIASKQQDSIYCEAGWYNTNDTIAFFHQNAWMKSQSNTILADTLFFDKVKGYGEAFSDILIQDTVNHILIHGNYGYFDNRNEYAYVTDSTLMIMIGQGDSLFLHSDTLYTVVDSLKKRSVLSYNQVRFYSRDLQGQCDSLTYSTADSVIKMFYSPVLWGQNNQMTAEYIELMTANNQAKQLNLRRGAFIISPEDSLGYNQLRGRNITGYFKRDNYLFKIQADEDAEAVFYAKDGPDYIGMNRAKSKKIRILLTEQRKFDEVVFMDGVDGKLYPIEKLPSESVRQLKGFVWLADERPKDKSDIYHANEAVSGAHQRAGVAARRRAIMVDGMISFADDEAGTDLSSGETDATSATDEKKDTEK